MAVRGTCSRCVRRACRCLVVPGPGRFLCSPPWLPSRLRLLPLQAGGGSTEAGSGKGGVTCLQGALGILSDPQICPSGPDSRPPCCNTCSPGRSDWPQAGFLQSPQRDSRELDGREAGHGQHSERADPAGVCSSRVCYCVAAHSPCPAFCPMRLLCVSWVAFSFETRDKMPTVNCWVKCNRSSSYFVSL